MSTVLDLSSFDNRAAAIRETVAKGKGAMPEESSFSAAPAEGAKKPLIQSVEAFRQNIMVDMRSATRQVDSLRAGSTDRRPIDLSWGDFVKDKWGFAATEAGQPENFYLSLGINPGRATMDSLMTMPDFDESYRWLIPEIIREAVRLGLRRNPIYTQLITAEETVNQPGVTLPYINMSDAMPTKLGENETIPTGTVSFGQKKVTLQKVGTGIKITDEVAKFVSLNILSLYLEDVGVKLNLALDSMFIDVAINGDGNSNPCPVIGINTPGTWSYTDLLRAWIRMGLLGRLPQGMLSNENPALDILTLPEFRGYGSGIGPVSGNQVPAVAKINLRTPVPTNQNYDIHGAMPVNNQVMLIDNRSAMIKLTASALRVESDRVAERQISGTYISLITGFAKLFDDATLILDKSLDYATHGFPTWMNPLGNQVQTFKS